MRAGLLNWTFLAKLLVFVAMPALAQQMPATLSPQAIMPMNSYAMAPWMMPMQPVQARSVQPGTQQGDPASAWVMSVMGRFLAMTNPYAHGQWMAAMNSPFVDQMTQHQALEAMMQAFDPQAMLGAAKADGFPKVVIPGFPTQSRRDVTPNTLSDGISSQAKRKAYQTMMMMSPLSMRDMIGIMADKMPVSEDVSFEDAVDAMKLRANEINFKMVGHSPLWLDVRAMTGDMNTPRVEIFHFCDAMVARRVLDHVPEFAVFLPCRVALLEDADRKLWVMTLDWDVSWMDFAQNPNNDLGDKLRADAKRIRDGIRYIMQGAATGDF